MAVLASAKPGGGTHMPHAENARLTPACVADRTAGGHREMEGASGQYVPKKHQPTTGGGAFHSTGRRRPSGHGWGLGPVFPVMAG